MNRLFSTLSRAALVAIGLSIAPVAFAQGTLTCPSGFAPLVNGNEVTCQMACASGTPTPTINGTSLSFTCSTGGGDVAPGTCTLGTSASSVVSGGSATLTAKCATGSPTSLTLTWTDPSGSVIASCPTSGTVNQNAQCALSNITSFGTYSVKFSNGVGTDVTKTVSIGQSSGGGGAEYSMCDGSMQIASGFKFPARNIYTNYFGTLEQGRGIVFKLVVSTQASASGQWSANFGGTKEWSLTTKACDFSGATTVQNQQGRATSFTVNSYLPPGTYYFNIREVVGCGGDCSMNGKLN